MLEKTSARHAVHVVADSDDFDGVASIGMAYREWNGVMQVLIEDDVGWWDERFSPYLLFYRGTKPSPDDSVALVQQAIESRSVHSGAYLSPDSRFQPCEYPYSDITLSSPESFAEMAIHGMKWGSYYPNVVCRNANDGTVHLLFYRNETDLPVNDESEISIDQLR